MSASYNNQQRFLATAGITGKRAGLKVAKHRAKKSVGGEKSALSAQVKTGGGAINIPTDDMSL